MGIQILKNNLSKGLLLALLLLSMTLVEVYAGCTYAEPLSAKEEDMGNLLTWTTSEEITTDYFQIQKSVDGVFFTSVGEVGAAGDSQGDKSYRFLDPAIGESKVYYRLLQSDIDGRSSFTHIAVLNKANKNNYLITMMGNTTTERYFNLVMNSKVTGLMSYRIENLNNKVLKTGEVNVVDGANLLSLDLDKLTNDRYQCVFVMNEEEEVVFLLKTDSEPLVDKK